MAQEAQEAQERPSEFISTTEVHKIRPGDKIEVTFSPNSQKHFEKPDFDYYFPTYTGTVISSNHTTLDEIILKNPITKETYACENKAGDESMTCIKRFLV